MKFLLTIFFLFLGVLCNAQQQINKHLKQQLDSVYTLDQKYRAMLTYLSRPSATDSLAKKIKVPVPQALAILQSKQQLQDSLNLNFISAVIKQYGYPGKTLVGQPANEIAWNVIAHANHLAAYLPLIKQMAESNELPFYLYATMLDRYLANQGKEQLYGSQCTCRQLMQGKHECFVWPIENAGMVNERRRSAGFKLTVEQNAEKLGIQYRVIKLSEIAKDN